MLKLGEIFKSEREKQKLTLDEVAANTRIKLTFLKYLETGSYESLPEKAYIEGFVRNYSLFLGLDSHKMLAIFRREYEQSQEKKILPENLYRKKRLSQRFKFTPLSLFIIFFILLIIGFIGFDFREAVFPPPLRIYYPNQNQVIKSFSVNVIGSTNADDSITINGEQTIVDKKGNFNQNITLLPGQKVIEIDSINKFGKKSTKLINITLK